MRNQSDRYQTHTSSYAYSSRRPRVKPGALLLFFSFFCMITRAEVKKGVVQVPLAHLVGQPLGADHAYHQLPVCGGALNPYVSCPRMHQLLLHETMDIIKEEGEELLIDIPHIFFVTESTKVPQTRYWTSRKNIITHEQLHKNGVDLKNIPKPISFQNPATLAMQDVVTLLKPFLDRTTGLTYSAGTRFVVSKIKENKKYMYVYALDGTTGMLRELKIPYNYLIKSPQGSADEKIQTFVDILKFWANQDGFIPYIWGGCSFSHLESSHTILEHQEERNGILHTWYTRKKPDAQNLFLNSGFDCAGLINRAAQMAGIPFFFKNTLTIAHNMHEISASESLRAGDIIWVRGHVMVIADTKRNTLIEARGYDSDFGKVHEIALHKVFEGIRTYADLKRSWIEKKPLRRLDKAGKIQDVFKTFKLLKLKSVFQKTS